MNIDETFISNAKILLKNTVYDERCKKMGDLFRRNIYINCMIEGTFLAKIENKHLIGRRLTQPMMEVEVCA